MSNQSNNYIVAFLSGIIAGGAVAYLASTKRGKELVTELLDNSKELASEIKEKVEETEQELEDRFKSAIDQLDIDELEQKGKDTISKISKKKP